MKTFSLKAQNFSAQNPLSVDHYHYFTHDEIREKDVLGIARVVELEYGNGTKSKNRGSFCIDKKSYRFAISEYRGLIGDWDIQKLEAVRVSTIVAIENDRMVARFNLSNCSLYA